MIGSAVFVCILLTIPLLMNVLMPTAKETTLVGLEVAITLATAIVVVTRSTQLRNTRVQAKLWLLAFGLVSLACAEGLCNVAFLQGNVRVRGETYAEVFYIGFWAALTAFMRWHYGPLWANKKWWPPICASLAFGAASYMQIRFVSSDLVAGAHILRAIPYLGVWIAIKSLFAVFAMGYAARAVATYDFIFSHSALALFCFAVSSSYRFAATGQPQYWVEYGWLVALCGIFFAVAGPSPSGGTLFTSPVQMSSWFSLRSLLGVWGFVACAAMLLATTLHGTLSLQRGLDLPFILWLMWCGWCFANYVALGMHQHMQRVVACVPSARSLTLSGGAPACDALEQLRSNLVAEFAALLSRYEQLASETVALAQAAMRADKEAELGRLASQVAHDIRSPLVALQMVLKDGDGLPHESQDIARIAIERVQDIANNLLTLSRQPADLPAKSEACTFVCGVAEETMSEKRSKFRNDAELVLTTVIAPDMRLACVPCSRIDLSRAISNLIDNAAEALHGRGRIALHISGDMNQAELALIDNGPGIAPAVLKELGQRGATFGKAHGNGLGLFGARQLAQSMGGSFRMDSTVGKGTSVHLLLPRCATPPWFDEYIDLSGVANFVIVDDDPSVHEVWAGKLRGATSEGLTVHCFRSPVQLCDWHLTNRDGRNTLYLVDHDFGAGQATGIDLIKQLQIKQHAILVSNRVEMSAVLPLLADHGFRAIPKHAVPFMNIRAESQTIS